jgi:hypothetical protein
MCGDRRENESGVTDEIEVTPEMIEAGIYAYLDCDREHDPDSQIVSQVFEAMLMARPPMSLSISATVAFNFSTFKEMLSGVIFLLPEIRSAVAFGHEPLVSCNNHSFVPLWWNQMP